MNNDLISRKYLYKEFKQRQNAALRWKEKAILDDDEERKIRADATLCFLSEVKLTIDNAPKVEVPENEVNCVLTMFGKCSYNKTGCSDCEIKEKIRKALEKEAKREERDTKRKEEREKIEAHAILYHDLKEGDLFRFTSVLSDKRIFRKNREGSTLIKDINGNTCNYPIYPYLTMKVYKLSEADNDT